MKLLKNERGFTVFEITLVVLVFAAIGAAGYFAYQARQNTESDYSVNVPKKTTSNQASGTSKPAPDSVAFVQQFYDEYLANSGNVLAIEIFKKYGTQNFVTTSEQAEGYDPVLCGQQGTSQAKVITAKQGDIVVATIQYPGTPPDNKTDAKVSTITSGGKLAIDSITCPR